MFSPGIFQLILVVSLITALVLLLIYRKRYRSISTKFFVIGGSIIGSFLIYPISIHPKINGLIKYILWVILGKTLGAGSPHYGVAGLLFLFVSILLIQVLGSLIGGLVGLRVGLKFFKEK